MATPVVDRRALMQAALASQPSQPQAAGQVPTGSASPQTTQMAPPNTTAQGAQAPTGGQPMTSNTDIANVIGSGVDLSQDPSAVTGIVQMLQDPGLPPEQRAELQMRLQLAALNSMSSGPSGAAGGQGG